MITRSLVVLCAALCLPGAALAGISAGLNLSWDDCGSTGTSAKSFACDTNLGTDILVASMRAPAGITQLTALEAQIDFRSSTSSLPDWWKHNSNPIGPEPLACRGNTGLEIDIETDFQTCADPWDTEAIISHHYDISFVDPNRARLVVNIDIAPLERALIADTEYMLFRVLLRHDKATGSGSCAGCSTPACIVFNEAKLTNGSSVVRVTDAAARNYVSWQSLPSACPGATSTRSSTWGQIRSLYR